RAQRRDDGILGAEKELHISLKSHASMATQTTKQQNNKQLPHLSLSFAHTHTSSPTLPLSLSLSPCSSLSLMPPPPLRQTYARQRRPNQLCSQSRVPDLIITTDGFGERPGTTQERTIWDPDRRERR